ncbi:hypothetical protein A3Q56_05318 [Intoshia linei]|uniref:Transcription initiation factor TFIID subunit 11 n=1 Tax=Intoshia linei TaxID=1819745 RepID=A0A177AY62_9BILA|nr:hypothetical protein A3Q56_05318 [Intoshia linei]
MKKKALRKFLMEYIHKGDNRESEKERMRQLYQTLSEDEKNRYEIFRRCHFNRTVIKRIMHLDAPNVSNKHVALIVSSLAKVFVGEIVEKALDCKTDEEKNSPLKPDHIRKSYEEYAKEHGSIKPVKNTILF